MADAGGPEHDLELAARLASITAEAVSLEDLARPFLSVLEEVTGYESTYLTVIHWEDAKQEVRYARNVGSLQVGEGALVEWSDTLCRRALLDGVRAATDVPQRWADSDAAREMGIVSYVSVPVVTALGATFGTLCAASGQAVPLADDARRLMELLARLLADQVDRERARADERERIARLVVRTQAGALAVASAEHKLKTPLTVIRAAAHRLRDETVLAPDDRRAVLDALERQARVLEVGVRELLEQARAGDELPALEREVVRLEPLLVRIVSDLRLVAPDRALSIACRDQLACIANGPALVHVLEHVLDNALKYTPAGTPVEVAADGDGTAVTVVVTDHGAGFGEGDPFEPFARGESGDGVEGTGLGLHVVRSLVEAMGGTVAAGTAPSGGAEVRIDLPGVDAALRGPGGAPSR